MVCFVLFLVDDDCWFCIFSWVVVVGFLLVGLEEFFVIVGRFGFMLDLGMVWEVIVVVGWFVVLVVVVVLLVV